MLDDRTEGRVSFLDFGWYRFKVKLSIWHVTQTRISKTGKSMFKFQDAGTMGSCGTDHVSRCSSDNGVEAHTCWIVMTNNKTPK